MNDLLTEKYLRNKFDGWRENSMTRVEVRHILRDQAEEIKKELEKEFIWGQVPYHDIASGTMKEWTMRCISDEDLQAFWSKKIKEG